MVTLVLLVGGGALALATLGGNGKGGGAFHGSPVPRLFDDAQIGAVDGPIKAAEARGHRVARAWLERHPVTTDSAFASWALQAVGAPPDSPTQARELKQLKALAASRGPRGITAATWLESHGKKQPWKVFLKQEKPFITAAQHEHARTALKQAFALGGRLQAAAKQRYARPSPYVADPTVHALNQARFAGQLRQSYPSKHTVDAGAALAILDPLAPHLVPEFDWMADEVAFSRLYAGGHYLSDLTAGAFLGTLIGEYERRKASLAPPS